MPHECVQCTPKHAMHAVSMAHAPWAHHAPPEHAVHPMSMPYIS